MAHALPGVAKRHLKCTPAATGKAGNAKIRLGLRQSADKGFQILKMNENKPRLALDMYVLAQSVKTGVYRVCDELFGRLQASGRFDTGLLVREGDDAGVQAYVASKGLSVVERVNGPSGADLLLSPFGVAPAEWLAATDVLHAHVIYDLIAIHRPDYFSVEAATEVRNIIASLTDQTVVIAISEHTKNDLLAYRPDLSPSQVVVVPLAAGSRFKPCADPNVRSAMRASYGIPARVPYVLSLATLEIRKNLDQVVRSFARFMEQHPQSDLHLVLAGMSGWKLDKLEGALVEAAQWRDRIVLTGFVDDADLSALYSDALCFVYLSRYEGFGLPLLEAMACGTPVICADNSSLPEVVGDAGFLLDADDLQGVVDAIANILGSVVVRDDLVRRGLERAALFDWDRSARMVADALLGAWDKSRKRPPHQRRRATAAEVRATLDANGLDGASFLGYQNGHKGPVFPINAALVTQQSAEQWPSWSDELPMLGATPRVQGGRRLSGESKEGTAENPLVSYITVVRNNKATLARTIESVQRQTYANVEHIVLDGASTDGTVDLILQHGDKLDYFVSEPDRGLYDAVNKAVPLARGQLICILNSDDWLEAHAAEIAVRRLKDNLSRPALLFTGANVQDGPLMLEWPPAFVHPGSYFMCANDCHNAIYATRDAYERSGPYDSSYKIAADFKWIMTCIESGSTGVYTNEITVNYSLGGASGDGRKHSTECMRVVSERFPFLSPVEVVGLYYSFFVFAGAFGDEQIGRPSSYTIFLRRVFARHESQADFLAALGWAAMAKLEHPYEAAAIRAPAGGPNPVLSYKRLLLEAIKTSLNRFPRLYRLAGRGYMRLRGK